MCFLFLGLLKICFLLIGWGIFDLDILLNIRDLMFECLVFLYWLLDFWIVGDKSCWMVWEFKLFCGFLFNCFFRVFKFGLICLLDSSGDGIWCLELISDCFFVVLIGVFGIVYILWG